MRVSIVFPVSLCLPNQLYYSLPALAGALKRAGHSARAVDLNMMAADMLLTKTRSERVYGIARDSIQNSRKIGNIATADAVERMLKVNEECVFGGEENKHILRDPVRNFIQPLFKKAFWEVVDALAFFYQLDPIISPFRENFGRDILNHDKTVGWSPLVDLYDEAMLDEVLRGKPRLVGVSVAFPEQAYESIRLAKLIKKRDPGIHICFGGPLIALHPNKWLENDWLLQFADSACIGDGETAIVELCEALEGKRAMENVRNLIFKQSNGAVHRSAGPVYLESMEDLPLPDFGAVDMDLYLTPRPIYPLMTSRGCYWGKCTFCSIGWRENFRMASDKKIREDLLHTVRQFGARYIRYDDSSLPPRGMRAIANVVKEEKLQIGYMAPVKFDKCFLDRDFCKHIGEGGARSFVMGLETMNQEIVDLMDKGFQLTDVPQMIRNLRDAGVSAELLWFIGFPGQTKKDVIDTARYLYNNREEFGLTAFVGDYILHPDTEVFAHPEKFGVTIFGRTNDTCHYVVDRGLQPWEAQELKSMLACNNNRTLVCNCGHLPHLVEGGLDMRGLERPMAIPDGVVDYCSS